MWTVGTCAYALACHLLDAEDVCESACFDHVQSIFLHLLRVLEHSLVFLEDSYVAEQLNLLLKLKLPLVLFIF